MMDRRRFLSILSGATVALAAIPSVPIGLSLIEDPELKLWVPGRKAIFLPPVKNRLFGVTAEELKALEELIGSFKVRSHSKGMGWSSAELVSHFPLDRPTPTQFARKPIESLNDDEFGMALEIVRAEAGNQHHHQSIVLPGSVDPWVGHPWRKRGFV